ncbi:MAG: PQQ-dependent sugar dehydrogenase [Candidatus Thorarchaeota archaeon]
MLNLNKKLILVFLTVIIVIIGVGMVFLLNIPKKTPSKTLGDYEYNIQTAFPNLTFSKPVGIYDPGDGSNRLFVVEQDGLIKVFENDGNVSDYGIFLDLSSDITTGGERGLLGLSFHPDYDINGYFFVYYTEEVTGDSIISRFKVDSMNAYLANKSSEVEILKVVQPYANHNGGQIQFGPDGYLYIALGDGGSSGDPDGHGQNRTTLLGSILRIDVDSILPYTIPNDNPFFGNVNGWAEEIYAFGFRNPWRFSFDPVTDFLWAADVGQSSREEIDIVTNGSNYGWSTREGTLDYNLGTNVTIIVDPIYEYNHALGISITGGYVYRGASLTGLVGKYIYGDYGSGRIWALEYTGGIVANNTLLIDTGLLIPSFGVDANNELYMCAFDGKIYKLTES